MSAYRIPAATYRVQFNRDFRFSDAHRLVPYLHDLGISDLYASPRFKAGKGSSHGYDVADPHKINSELGTKEEFEQLVRRLKDYGMGLLLDIVPNHMSASSENPWWMDVLENGPSSAYAGYFDIDWHPATTKAAFLQENKVILPVLGDYYGSVLENQELTLKIDENGFFVRYVDHRLPLDPKSYRFIFEPCLEILRALPDREVQVTQLAELIRASDDVPAYTTTDEGERQRRRVLVPPIKTQIWKAYHADPNIRNAVDQVLLRFNGVRNDPASFNDLDGLLNAQPYRLAHWKIGMEEINYRRFFDINGLIGIRVRDPRVFADRHKQIIQLVRENIVTGLRIDHIDGLNDPLGYLSALQRAADPVSEGRPQPIFIVVEKIIGAQEKLPEEWPVAGTTGYDFLNAVNALFIHPTGWEQLENIYSRFTGSAMPFAELCYSSNKKVMQELFAGEIQALSHHLGKLAARHRHARDLPLYELVQLLIEVTACLPVYRTYVRDFHVRQPDREMIEQTLALARSRTRGGRVSDLALAFLRSVLLLEPPFYAPDERADYLQFVMRWQQFSGPVMAKGLEDTAFYIHNSMISLNEVGGDPLRQELPLGVDRFHQFHAERQACWPHTLNATSTHDTKRGEDVRARVNVLSELSDEWAACLGRWSRWNRPHGRMVAGHRTPAPHEEVLLYETMLGAWPLQRARHPGFKARMREFIVKAAREAKIDTSWLSQNTEHEQALESFVESILDAPESRFLKDFVRFQKKLAFYGLFNSLSQLLCKIASPGLPDFYQGTELWDLNLVDPDNRRTVDFNARRQLLEKLAERGEDVRPDYLRGLLKHWTDGRVKLYLMWRALRFRRAHTELFQKGAVVPLTGSKEASNHLCAFARHHEKQWAIVVVPRLLASLVKVGDMPIGRRVWGASSIVLPRHAPAHWSNVLTGEHFDAVSVARTKTLRLDGIFGSFPVALLCSDAVHGGREDSGD
jgi:(1->4)-alpha-D-glucan 1-alpha-D-glucosylmutase